MIFLNVIIFCLISVIGLFATYSISHKFNFFDYPDKKKIHSTKTPNIGGIAIIFLFITSLIIYDYSFDQILIYLLSVSIIIIGFIDDLKNFKAISKLLLISFPVIFFIYNIAIIESLGNVIGYNLNLGNFSFFFTFMCMLLLINAN